MTAVDPGASGRALDGGEGATGRAASRNTAALLASRLAVAAMGWFGSILIARALSPTRWGEFSFVFSLLGLLGVVTDLGVSRVVLVRLVGGLDPAAQQDPVDREDARHVVSAFIALRAVLGLLGYGLALAYVIALGYPAEVVQATAVGGLVVVVATPSHALTLLFQSRLRLTVVAAAEALGQVVQLVLTVLAALLAPRLLVFVLPAVVNEVVKAGLKLRGVRRGDTGELPARTVQLWRWGPMLREAVPLALGTALTTLLYKVDVLLLSHLDTFESVGLYSVGYKFADVLEVVGSAVLGPVMTLLVAAWPGDPAAFRERSRRTALLLGMLAALAGTTFWVATEPVVTLLYGARFAPATTATRLVVLGACLALLSQLGFTLLVAAGRQRVYPVVGVAGLGLNVGLNLILIPRYSIEGAAAATVATEVVVLAVMFALVRQTIPVRGLVPTGRLAALLAASIGVALGGLALAPVLPWPVLVVLAAIAVLLCGWALGVPGVDPALLRMRRAAR